MNHHFHDKCSLLPTKPSLLHYCKLKQLHAVLIPPLQLENKFESTGKFLLCNNHKITQKFNLYRQFEKQHNCTNQDNHVSTFHIWLHTARVL